MSQPLSGRLEHLSQVVEVEVRVQDPRSLVGQLASQVGAEVGASLFVTL